MLSRRGVLLGLLAAPAIIRTPGLLMPIKSPVRFGRGGEYQTYWLSHYAFGGSEWQLISNNEPPSGEIDLMDSLLLRDRNYRLPYWNPKGYTYIDAGPTRFQVYRDGKSNT